jgi:hypothetical protein
MNADARDYLAADSIIRNLLRVVGNARIVVDQNLWAVFQKGSDGIERQIVSGRDLCELVTAVGKLVIG